MTIYCITNRVNKKKYIGISKTPKSRWKTHRCTAFNPRAQMHHAPLYRAIRKYGLENFSFEIIHEEECSRRRALELEGQYIIQFNTLSPNGYNLEITGLENGEKISTPESIKKWSIGAHSKKSGHSSDYHGVFVSQRGIYCNIIHDGKEFTKGGFETEEEAAAARDRCALHLYGSDATLNFPAKRATYLQEDVKAFFSTLFKSKKSSQYKGVSYNKSTKKWMATLVTDDGKIQTLGKYDNEIEAATVYDLAVVHSKKAKTYGIRLNFPEKEGDYASQDIGNLLIKKKQVQKFNVTYRPDRLRKYEGHFKHHGKYIYCGAYDSFEQAREAILDKKQFLASKASFYEDTI